MKDKQIKELIEPVIEDLGFQLWGIEYMSHKGGALLRVYIDHANGIDVNDCASCSREISGVLEVEDPITSAYTLEVSSPGLDRILFDVEHFKQFNQQRVKIKLAAPVNGARKLKGLIDMPEASDDVAGTEAIRIMGDDELVYEFTINNVMRARLIPEY